MVSGKLNISDRLTRGKCPNNLDKTSTWQMGAEFLSRKFEQWPITQKVGMRELPGRTKIIAVQTAMTQITDSFVERIDIIGFIKYKLLCNTTAQVLKLYGRFNSFY